MSVATVQLGELCDILSGFAWSASKFNRDGRGVPIIRIQNVDAVSDNDFVYWDDSYDERFVIHQGDLLLTLSGSFRIESWSGPNALLNQRIIKLTPSPKLDRGWLLHVLRPRLGQIERLGKHALVNNVSLGDIRNLVIPLPPLAEQRRIAEVLDRAEALRAKRRAALAQLDSLSQSLFFDLFGDPVINPKRIPKRPLGEMIRVKSGDSLLVSELSDSGEFPVYGGNGINGYHTRFMFDSPIIVIGRVGVYCGVVHITKLNAWVTDNALFIAKISPELELRYLAEALTIANLNQYAGRAAQPLVSGSRIYPVEILVPSIDLQREFARRLGAVEELKTTQRASLAELDALFASLQHRAFRGEL